MRPARKKEIRKNSKRIAIVTALAGLAGFFVIGGIVMSLGAGVDAETLSRLLIAKSFSWEPFRQPFFTPVKMDFLFSTPISHFEALVRPLTPVLLALADVLGFHSPERGTWLGVLCLAGSMISWAWALRPNFDRDREALAAGCLVVACLLLQVKNHLLPELQLGGPMPVAILIGSLAYGALARRKAWLAGSAAAALYFTTTSGELLALSLVLASLGSHAMATFTGKARSDTAVFLRKSLLPFFLTFVVLTLPWWIMGWIQNGSQCHPFLPDLARSFLRGRAAFHDWLQRSDDGGGAAVWNSPTHTLYQQFVRARWFDWITPFVGDYFNELVHLSLFWFGIFLYALWRPRHRLLSLLAGFGVLVWISADAGWVYEFDNRRFLVLNAVFIALLLVVSWDASRAWAWLGRTALLLMVFTNSATLLQFIQTGSPMPHLLSGGASEIATAALRLDVSREPVMADGTEMLRLGYFAPELPTVKLPSNFRSEEVLDRFIDRWKIRWTTHGEELSGVLKEHRLTPSASPGFWEIRPLR